MIQRSLRPVLGVVVYIHIVGDANWDLCRVVEENVEAVVWETEKSTSETSEFRQRRFGSLGLFRLLLLHSML